MWKGFDSAEGWQFVSTLYSSAQTSLHLLRMYSLESCIRSSQVFAFKVVTVMACASSPSIKSLSQLALKSKDLIRVRSEVEALKRLKLQPNIVELLDILIEKESDNAFFSEYLGRKNKKGRSIALIMEYLPNYTISQMIHQYNFEDEKLLAYAFDILDGLKALKSQSILHRDLRTSNLILSEQCIKIIDFDCAFIENFSDFDQLCFPFNQNSTAPELIELICNHSNITSLSAQLLYKKQEKCDIYSFGAILYEILLKEQYSGVLDKQKCRNRRINEGWVSILQGLLQINPEKRLDLDKIENMLLDIGARQRPQLCRRQSRINSIFSGLSLQDYQSSLSSQTITNSLSMSDWSLNSNKELAEPKKRIFSRAITISSLLKSENDS